MSRLIFIYSARSGIIANITGAIKKALGRMSDCALCNITYGVATKKPTWASFVATLSTPPVFYHQDEIPSELKQFLDTNGIHLPVVLEENNTSWKVIVNHQELTACEGNASSLIQLLKERYQ